jgi:pimeloyl-ACP methyl ester carboxylesterase
MRLTAAAAGVALLTLLAACAGGKDPGRDATPSSHSAGAAAASSTPTRQVDANGFPLPTRPECAADVGGRFVVTQTSQGNGVGILVLGRGSSGIVLSPQSDGDICQWLHYGQELADRYRVALFDWDVPRREVPRLAVEELRNEGVRRVVLAGASLGGAYALAYAHAIRPRLAGVISFSGETTLRGGFDGRPGIRAWHGPLLLLGSVRDAFFDRADAREVARLHAGSESVLMVGGNRHGVDLLTGPDAGRVRTTVDRFLQRVLSSPGS